MVDVVKLLDTATSWLNLSPLDLSLKDLSEKTLSTAEYLSEKKVPNKIGGSSGKSKSSKESGEKKLTLKHDEPSKVRRVLLQHMVHFLSRLTHSFQIEQFICVSHEFPSIFSVRSLVEVYEPFLFKLLFSEIA